MGGGGESGKEKSKSKDLSTRSLKTDRKTESGEPIYYHRDLSKEREWRRVKELEQRSE